MRSRPSLTSDERAIEGLPIRLVIALVVGVASLAVMMQILGGIGTPGQTEVGVEVSDELISSGDSTDITVVAEDGEEVTEARVLITNGTLNIEDGPIELGLSGGSTGTLDTTTTSSSTSGRAALDWKSNQQKGTLQIEVIPPSDSDFVDEEDNTEIVVTR